MCIKYTKNSKFKTNNFMSLDEVQHVSTGSLSSSGASGITEKEGKNVAAIGLKLASRPPLSTYKSIKTVLLKIFFHVIDDMVARRTLRQHF
jgi:hypothetical protein